MRRRELIGLVGGAAAVARPLSARAQKAMPVIGFLHSGTAEQNARRLQGFRKGLSDAGFVEDQNVMIDYRWADGKADRLPEMVADLVRRQVAVIATLSSQPATLAAKAATTTIPIVFTWPGDPVDSGLVASLNRPGGNATGISTLNYELAAKRLGLLREVAPKATAFFVLLNPADPGTEKASRDLQATARTVGVQLQILYAGSDREIDAAFATLASRPAAALVVNADPFLFIRRAQITALAARAPGPPGDNHPPICRQRRPDELWNGPAERVGAGRHLCGAHSQRRETGRAARRATNKIRAGHQPQDRQGAWPGSAVEPAVHRRRGDRMSTRPGIKTCAA
jgi:putative ABC transport system substrate-binding protein